MRDVTVCPYCRDEIKVPRIEQLHRSLAMAVIRRPGRLTPHEIRFLRKWRGWSGADFARTMGVDRATVSRWESVDSPQVMGPVADRLLRLAAAHGEPADEYPVSTLAELDRDGDRTALLRMRASRTSWEESAAA